MGEIALEFQTKKGISWISILGKSLGQHQRSNRTTSPTTVAEDLHPSPGMLIGKAK